MNNIVHTKWKISKEPYEAYKAKRKMIVIRLIDDSILDKDAIREYLDSQLGKTYNWEALLTHAAYILTLPLQKLFKAKCPWWIGKVGEKAENKHVCSELGATALNKGASIRLFQRPWTETAVSLRLNPLFRVLDENEPVQTGDIGLVTTNSFLALIIRLFTRSKKLKWKDTPNHVVVVY